METPARSRFSFRASRVLGAALLLLAACPGRKPSASTDAADAPEPAPDVAAPDAPDLAAHLRELERKVPPGFTVIPEPPFVVVGEEPPERVRAHAEVVRWTVRMLRRDFFAADLPRPVDVWLFADETSYRKWAWEIFHDRPSTPYGYYSPAERALIMNISTGGGTLVHELVHPLLHADFPDVPPWFNECLAALFEQCGEEDGHVVGRLNWRLPGLQRAIRDGRTWSFDELFALSADDFYARGTGLETAEARYICYYLQEHGLLRSFYREFRAARARDPTGRETLLRVLDAHLQPSESFAPREGTVDCRLSTVDARTCGRLDAAAGRAVSLPAVQDDWKRFVLALTYDP